MIDLHSHILPGIDDGAKSFDVSLAILKGLREHGVSDVVATPHFVNGSSYMSTVAENRQLVEMLQEKADEADLDIEIHLGNEIYIDSNIAELVKRGKVSALAGSKTLLVELPMSGDYTDYEDILLSLTYSGYTVILAHPERYYTMQRNFKLITNLTDNGILLQCNLGSIIGQYGRHAQKTMKKLAKKKLIFAIGTDTHHVRDWEEIPTALAKLGKYYSEAELKQITTTNARHILTSAK